MQFHRSDLNQQEIAEFYRRLGAEVEIMSPVASFDLLVQYHDVITLVEVKNLNGGGKSLTKKERKFHERFNVKIVWDLQTAAQAIGAPAYFPDDNQPYLYD